MLEAVFLPHQIFVLALKPWRLVRELDRYSDKECRGFMKSLSLWRVWLLILSLPIAMLFGVKLLALTELANEAITGRGDWVLDAALPGERALGMLYTVVVLFGSAAAAFIPYAAILRRVVRRRYASLACLKCRYSIVGLPVANGYVRCPECGQDICLDKQGWSEKDIIAGKSESKERCATRSGLALSCLAFAAFSVMALGGWIASGGRVYLNLFVVLAALTLVMGLPSGRARD